MNAPSPRARPRLVIFDLDGTLVDSAPDIAAAANELLAGEGLPAHSLPAVRTMIGDGLERLVERAFAAHGVELARQALRQRYAAMMTIYARHLTNLTVLRAGAREAVLASRRAGIATAVATNKPEGFSRTILSHFDLASRIDCVIGGDSGHARKPAPDMLLAACGDLGAAPAETVMVGDGRADLLAARAAGMTCVLVRGGYCDVPVESLGPDLVIDELDALPATFGMALPLAP